MHKKMRNYRQIWTLLLALIALMPLQACGQDADDDEIVSVEASQLTFPNAFSPNGDGRNDVYKAKTCQNIVEFRAYIYNRWGEKLYEWSNPDEGWDGTSGGRDVPEGVYFVLVKAKGGDGKTYNIRKDVNLLRYKDETR